MIVPYAVCDGCGYKEPAQREQHPTVWPTYIANRMERRFCSSACALRHMGGSRSADPTNPWFLTDREIRYLELVAQGCSNQEIGAALFLAESTVKNTLAKVYRKLGVQDRLQAVVKAHALGILSLPGRAEPYELAA